MYYGNKPNASFFLFYGFVVENNDNDDITLTLGLDETDPLRPLKEKLLGPTSVRQRLRVARTTDDAKFPRLISYLRFAVFRGKEAEASPGANLT